MIDVVLSLLVQVVIEKLASPVLDKLRDLYNLKENIKKLQQTLPKVQALLEDAEKKQSSEKTIELWLLDLKDVTYESEDLWDELVAEITLCESRSSIKDHLRGFLLPFEPTRNLFYLANKLQEKLCDLDEIVEEGFQLNLREVTLERGHGCLGRRKGMGSHVVGSKIYGREEDKKKILEILLRRHKGKSIGAVSLIPIIGIGGLGKTILTELVYNDEKVTSSFDLKIWVHVSEVFDVRKVITSIVEAANGDGCKFLEMDMLQSRLQKALSGKKFLLVLDDVWTEDQEEWDELRDLFESYVEGSKIIVTTRSEKVASIMDNSSKYFLGGLLEDDSWTLFKRQALFEEEKHPSLYPIGKRIVEKCVGVPLAIKIMGSLLQSTRDEEEWLFVQDSELWDIKECQKSILPVLKLSYTRLPLHLKRCLIFISLFPKNSSIQKEKLIHIWMAQGLIQPSGGNRLLEDIGNEYLNDLLCLSFIQELKRSEDGTIIEYKMHDLIHDLARSIGGREFLILSQCLSPINLTRTRHLSINCKFNPSSFPNSLFEAKHLRTLMFFFSGINTDELLANILDHFVYLRVLDVSGCGIKILPKSIGALICLRYLDLANNPFQILPYTICNLFNLQSLNLSGCYNLVELPFGLANIVGLRHLNTTGCVALSRMPIGIGKLVHLQTLPMYIVGPGRGESILELNTMNLQGELNVKCLENVRDEKEAKTANLKEKRRLHHLLLEWGNNDENVKQAKDILNSLEPHQNLKKLFIKGYPGAMFPHWNLMNLTVIVFINCRKCRHLPPLGQLPLLGTLCLQGMEGITVIYEEFYSSGPGEKPEKFPSLKELILKDFPNLVKWSMDDSVKAFPRLQKLIIDKCPKLESSPMFQSLHHLELRDCHSNVIKRMGKTTSISVLVIDTCSEFVTSFEQLLKSNASLKSLELRRCKNLKSLPSNLELLHSLKSLVIIDCKVLSSFTLGLKMLKNLEYLEINGNDKLIILPMEIVGLSSLKVLSIEDCTELRSLSRGVHHLTALEQLSISSCPELDSLPEGLQNLSSLHSMNIVDCPKLAELPDGIKNIKSLRTLVIHSCKEMTVLPRWFGNLKSLRSISIYGCDYLKTLPEGLESLCKLQHLSIQDCPQLERLLKRQRGKEWQKIAHVPYIYIGSLKLGKYRSSSST